MYPFKTLQVCYIYSKICMCKFNEKKDKFKVFLVKSQSLINLQHFTLSQCWITAHVPMRRPGSGVVLDCIDSRSLPSFLLSIYSVVG